MRKISYKGLVKKLDGIIREQVREREQNTCQWCGKTDLVGFDSQPSHVIPKGRCTFLRWDLMNIVLLCAFCHREKWHTRALGRQWFDQKYPEHVKYLEDREHTTVLKKRQFAEEELGRLTNDQGT